MIPPGALGLLEAMADGRITVLEPAFEHRTGAISYPELEAYLRETDRGAQLLESLADRGVLEREFREKVYQCPDCDFAELRYTTVCPACESMDLGRDVVVEHFACGFVAPRGRFDGGEEYVCPKCHDSLGTIGVEYATVGDLYACDSCDGRFDHSAERLLYRGCSAAVAPSNAPESVLYRYRFDESSREWLRSLLSARRAVTEALREKGFDVAWEGTITGESGREHPMPLVATDDCTTRSLVAAFCDEPTVADVIDLATVSADVDAGSALIAVGEPDEYVSDLAAQLGVGVLRVSASTEPSVSIDLAREAQ